MRSSRAALDSSSTPAGVVCGGRENNFLFPFFDYLQDIEYMYKLEKKKVGEDQPSATSPKRRLLSRLRGTLSSDWKGEFKRNS